MIALVIAIAVIAGIALMKNANKIAKHELDQILGKNFTVQEVKLKWNKVEAKNVSYRNQEGKTIFHTDSLILSTDITALLKKNYNVSSATLVNPYLILEKDRSGEFKNPFPSRKENAEGKKSHEFRIQKIEIINGSLDYVDAEVSGEPVVTELRNIDIESDNVIFPLQDSFTNYRFTAKISGKLSAGTIKSEGKIALKSFDMDSKVEAKDLDVTHFKSYYQKKGSVVVKKGLLDLDMDLKIESGKVSAPGKAALRDLLFESENGANAKFLDLPLRSILTYLRENNDSIAFDFTLESNISDPKSSIISAVVQDMKAGIAERTGLKTVKTDASN